MTNPIVRTARAGFTLVEVLVTLVLIALLVGVIVPSVIGQLGKGDPTRIMSDLEGVRSGVKMFRIDVKRYPSTIEQLVQDPCESVVGTCDENNTAWASAAALPDGVITEGLMKRWAGPYVEGLAPTGTGFETALGGTISETFTDTRMIGGVAYLVAEVTGLSQTEIQNIDDEFDDGEDLTGRIQITDDGGTPASYTMHFYAVPLN